MSKQKIWCLVRLPNDRTLAVDCEPKSIGQECLEKVCNDLDIFCEMDYFGLTRTQDEFSKTCCEKSLASIRPWINLRNALRPNHQFSGNEILLDLKIKFWVPPHLILQENVRNIFYMQACKELIEGRLKPSSWEMAAQLISLLAQADGLKYNSSATATAATTIGNGMCEDRQQLKRRRLSKRKASDPSQFEVEFADHKVVEVKSPTSIYDHYLSITPTGVMDAASDAAELVERISVEHQKLTKLKVSVSSAKYWLLEQISHLPAYGEEKFSAVLMDETQQEVTIGVSPDGLQVYKRDETLPIPFTAIAAAKSLRRVFRLEYLDEEHCSQELELKLLCHHAASALYRSITEKHSFYLCETVRSSVTDQFIRDLKGTIISMFNEDTEHGKRYVFDIQRTCREVYDNSRRILHAKGIEISTVECHKDVIDVDAMLEKQANQDRLLESVVEQKISDALNCRICMDCEVNMVFNCGHMFCADCAEKCERCPVCRSEITAINKVFLPTELRNYSSSAKQKIMAR